MASRRSDGAISSANLPIHSPRFATAVAMRGAYTEVIDRLDRTIGPDAEP